MFWKVLFVLTGAAISSTYGCRKLCPCQPEIDSISFRLGGGDRARDSLVDDLTRGLNNISLAVGDLSQGVVEVRHMRDVLERLNRRLDGMTRHLNGLISEDGNCTKEAGDDQPQESPKECPTGWVSHGGSCYYFQLSKVRLTQDTAKQQCESKYPGSNLVAIETSDEYNFIKKYLKDRYQSIRGSTTNGWLTSGKKVDGSWKWTSTGADIDFNSAVHWGGAGLDGLPCLSIYPSHGFDMSSVYCSSYDRQFVCEI